MDTNQSNESPRNHNGADSNYGISDAFNTPEQFTYPSYVEVRTPDYEPGHMGEEEDTKNVETAHFERKSIHETRGALQGFNPIVNAFDSQGLYHHYPMSAMRSDGSSKRSPK